MIFYTSVFSSLPDLSIWQSFSNYHTPPFPRIGAQILQVLQSSVHGLEDMVTFICTLALTSFTCLPVSLVPPEIFPNKPVRMMCEFSMRWTHKFLHWIHTWAVSTWQVTSRAALSEVSLPVLFSTLDGLSSQDLTPSMSSLSQPSCIT